MRVLAPPFTAAPAPTNSPEPIQPSKTADKRGNFSFPTITTTATLHITATPSPAPSSTQTSSPTPVYTPSKLQEEIFEVCVQSKDDLSV